METPQGLYITKNMQQQQQQPLQNSKNLRTRSSSKRFTHRASAYSTDQSSLSQTRAQLSRISASRRRLDTYNLLREASIGGSVTSCITPLPTSASLDPDHCDPHFTLDNADQAQGEPDGGNGGGSGEESDKVMASGGKRSPVPIVLPGGNPKCRPTPEIGAQKAIVEPLLDKQKVEGEFWYIIVSEWLSQWKRHVGSLTLRKYYHNRSAPGPVLTMKEYGYSTELIHEEAFKLLVNWYGLTEGHNINKHIVYNYRSKHEVEHNFNTFKLSLSNNANAEVHQLRFSKLEKVGHIECKARELYSIEGDKFTRLWAKPIDTDTHWKPIFRRDKAIGKVLELDSDFLRSAIIIEVCDPDGVWRNKPGPRIIQDPSSQVENPIGKLYDQSIFEDITSSWELDIHEQIEDIGRDFLKQLHMSFSGFITKAKDFVQDREHNMRDKEDELMQTEEYVRTRDSAMDRREMELNARMEQHQEVVMQFDRQCEQRVRELDQEQSNRKAELERAQWDIVEGREQLDKDKQAFQDELQVTKLHFTLHFFLFLLLNYGFRGQLAIQVTFYLAVS